MDATQAIAIVIRETAAILIDLRNETDGSSAQTSLAHKYAYGVSLVTTLSRAAGMLVTYADADAVCVALADERMGRYRRAATGGIATLREIAQGAL